MAGDTLADTIADAAVEVIGNGRKGTEYVVDGLWRKLVLDALKADPRFVRSSGGMWELADVREERHRAFVGEPAQAEDRGAVQPKLTRGRAPRKRAAA